MGKYQPIGRFLLSTTLLSVAAFYPSQSVTAAPIICPTEDDCSSGSVSRSTLRPGEVLRVAFEIPNSYSDPSGDAVPDMLSFNLQLPDGLSFIGDAGGAVQTKLFNGTKLLGTNTATASQWPYTLPGGVVPMRFYSKDESWDRFPWEQQVNFTSIRDRTITGYIDFSVSEAVDYNDGADDLDDLIEVYRGTKSSSGSTFTEIDEGGVRILGMEKLTGRTPIAVISAPPKPVTPVLPPTMVAAKPTIVITHGWQLSGEPPAGGSPTDPARALDWVKNMKDAIGDRANVITWTWDEAFSGASGLGDATSFVASSGIRLGQVLKNLGDDALENIHFIGHSLGTLVNAYATDYLTKRGYEVEQFTILDRPFGNSKGVELLFNVDPKNGETAAFTPFGIDEDIFRHLLKTDKVKYVDNYYGTGLTATGSAFLNANAYDVKRSGVSHSGVHAYYQCTIKNCGAFAGIDTTDTDIGFQMSRAATGNSPMFPDGERWDAKGSPFVDSAIAFDPVEWLRLNCEGTSELINCSEGSPAYFWDEEFLIPSDVGFLSFEFRWNEAGDGDWLSLHFGDRQLFSFLGTDTDIGVWLDSGLIPLAGLRGLSDQLLFMLNSVGDANASFSLRGLKFYALPEQVPEPTPLGLLGLGLGGMLAFRRRKVRAAKAA